MKLPQGNQNHTYPVELLDSALLAKLANNIVALTPRDLDALQEKTQRTTRTREVKDGV